MPTAASRLSPSVTSCRPRRAVVMAGERGEPWFLPAVVAAHAKERGGETAYCFLSGDSVAASLSFAELHRETLRVAAVIAERTAAGDRVVLAFAPGLAFIAAFLATLTAGRVAVPAMPPASRASTERFRAILADAEAAAVLTSRGTVASAPELARQDLARMLIAVDDTPGTAAVGPADPAPGPADTALLQYTSGSTADPKGVVVTHRNLAAAQDAIDAAFRSGADDRGLTWLPMEHDMGLVGGALHLLWHGGTLFMMPPAAFVRRPLKWLEAIGRHRITVSGGPDSAYRRCVDALAAGRRTPLDLSSWRVAFNGAEPVDPATLDRFADAFGPAGFRRTAFLPCYGLAEATLLVAGANRGAGGSTVAAPRDGRPLVSCGRPRTTGGVAVVDPVTRVALPEGREGEVWVRGESVAAGYFRRPDASRETFGAFMADGRGPYLRSGDLGVVAGGELAITGRLKDIVLLGGRTLHPQDLERVAGAAHPSLRFGRTVVIQPCAAGGVEVIQEVAGARLGEDAAAVARAIWRALLRHDGVAAGRVTLVRPGSLLWTTSGKIRRRDTHAAVRADAGSVLADWTPEADGVGSDAPGRLAAVAALAARGDAPARSDLEAFVLGWAGAVLGVPPETVEPDVAWADLGLTSLLATEFVLDLEAATGRDLPIDLLFEATTPDRLVARLSARLP